MFDDEYAKNHISILIDFKTLILNKKIIKKLRKAGFKFAIAFSDTTILPPKERSSLYMGTMIVINKKEDNYEEVEKFIPNDLKDIIIYDDVYSRYNSIEGE